MRPKISVLEPVDLVPERARWRCSVTGDSEGDQDISHGFFWHCGVSDNRKGMTGALWVTRKRFNLFHHEVRRFEGKDFHSFLLLAWWGVWQQQTENQEHRLLGEFVGRGESMSRWNKGNKVSWIFATWRHVKHRNRYTQKPSSVANYVLLAYFETLR